MQLLAPFMLIGLIGLALPIAIHLLNRSRNIAVDWPTLRFLQMAHRQTAQGARIRHWFVLLLRCLLLALIMLAMAQPYTQDSDWAAPPDLPTTLVIAIDRSYSMDYQDLGAESSRFERAKQAALDQLSQLTIDDEVALVLFDDRAESLTPLPTRDHQRVAQLIRDATLSRRGTDVATAIPAAFALVQLDAPPDQPTDPADAIQHPKRSAWRHVLLLTDLQRSAWDRIIDQPFAQQLADTAHLTIVDLGDHESANRFIRRIKVNRIAMGSRMAVEVDVAHDGRTTADAGLARLWIDDRQLGDPVPVPTASRRITLTADIPAGAHRGRVEIGEDRLTLDDRAYFALRASDDRRLIIVDGNPSRVAPLSETHFIELAVAAGVARAGDLDIDRLTVDQLARTSLGTTGCLMLANPPPLDGAALARVESFLRAGGNVCIALGDQTDPAAFNQDWPFLPLQLDRQLGDPRRSRAYAVLVDAPKHPIFADELDLSATRFFAFIGSDPTTLRDDARILASLSNGSPWIIEGRFPDAAEHAGRVLLIAAGLDADWSNLPYRRVFVPLVDRIVSHMTQPQLRAGTITLGQPVRFTAPPSAAGRSISITTPNDTTKTIPAALTTDRRTAVAVFDQTHQVGHYRIDADPAFASAAAFAVNLDTRESVLAPADPDDIVHAMGDAHHTRVITSQPTQLTAWAGALNEDPQDHKTPWWPWLLLLAFGVFVAETCLANIFTRRAVTPPPPTIEYQAHTTRSGDLT
ncbi:MAG: hypothetical protein CMJ49_10775 [Planctomycetaceae bacterium]|nr:hypothetical protein [Planctomycetaceae bacterium]